MTAATLQQNYKPPARVTVGGKLIKARREQTWAWRIIGGFACVMAVSGVYFVFLQLHWYYWPGHSVYYWPGHEMYLKKGWDDLIHRAWWTSGLWRHGERNDIEGAAALVIGIKALASEWQPHWKEKISDVNLVLRFIGTLVVAVILVNASLWIATFGAAMIDHATTHPYPAYLTPPTKYTELIYIAIGLVVGWVVSKLIWRPAGTAVQRYLAEQLAQWWGRTGRIPTPVKYPLLSPQLREEASWIYRFKVPMTKHGLWVKWFLFCSAPVFVGFMVVGILVRFTHVIV